MSEPWRHDYVHANGIRFHYVTAGTGPLVLLLHGFPQFWYAWRHQIPVLAERFRVVAPDLRGYGDTDKPPEVSDYRTTTLARDVVELVHALGEKTAHVVGHDWGGGVAWTVALRHPEVVSRLAILNCPHPIPFGKALRSSPRQLLRSWYMFFFQIPWVSEWALLRDDMAENTFRGMSVRKDAFSDADIAAFRAALAKPGAATGALNYYRAAFRNFGDLAAIEKERPKISAPTLLIWGEQDIALGKELTCGMEPLFSGSFRIEYVPESSHWVNEEQPEKVNRWLLEFLKS